MCHEQVLLETAISSAPLYRRGKVRDVYDLGNQLLFVATDRISAFDCVLPSGIPSKGRVLTQMSLFWFEFLREIVPSHLITADIDRYPSELARYRDQLRGRSMLVKKAEMIEFECVARGYLAGSGWKDYLQTGSVCSVALPQGLLESDRLPAPIFTPATKAQSGHDINVPFAALEHALGAETAARIRALTLDIYTSAAQHALACGIILADTKFEFGMIDGQLILGDEVLTPDSSRYWPADTYRPGGPQLSFDKQFVRDYLETLSWDKRPPAPALPDDVVRKTCEKYQEAYRRLAGRDLA